MKLGVLLAGHVHPWEELVELVRLAEDLGYAAAWIDGDVSMLGQRHEADALDGWTATIALLASTRRIPIGSLRLVHHWNAARLAQAVATAERIAPGRLRFFITIGDRPDDEHFGFIELPAGERVCWLDETLTALRALWRGDTVTMRGRHVRLEEARVRPTPPGGRVQIAVAARRPKLLEIVAAHADVWDVNLPPIPDRVEAAAALLADACRARGRDPNDVSRSMLIFTRVEDSPDRTAALREFRRLNPWFREIPDHEVGPALVVGSADTCRERIRELADALRLDHPILDLSGVPREGAKRVIEALAPAARGS